MEEPAFLVAMDRNVGGVQIQHDLLWHRIVRCTERVGPPPVDRIRVHDDFLVPLLGAEADTQPTDRATRLTHTDKYLYRYVFESR